jgi:hypothetical protein
MGGTGEGGIRRGQIGEGEIGERRFRMTKLQESNCPTTENVKIFQFQPLHFCIFFQGEGESSRSSNSSHYIFVFFSGRGGIVIFAVLVLDPNHWTIKSNDYKISCRDTEGTENLSKQPIKPYDETSVILKDRKQTHLSLSFQITGGP